LTKQEKVYFLLFIQSQSGHSSIRLNNYSKTCNEDDNDDDNKDDDDHKIVVAAQTQAAGVMGHDCGPKPAARACDAAAKACSELACMPLPRKWMRQQH
jgi:hypothetical protein